MEEILEVLEKNGRQTPAEIATMLGKTEAEVAAAIADFEARHVINAYTAIINWDLTGTERVTALIEVKLTPERDRGFDKVAERIYNFPEVKSCYLMSGGFDLTVVIEDTTMKEVALFVAEKLAPVPGVTSTATHFILKKYKDKGFVFGTPAVDDREHVIL